MKKTLWLWFVRSAFKIMLRLLAFIPWPTALALGEAIGTFGFRISARYRRVGDKNLRFAYGDAMTQQQRDTIIRRVFQNFARSALIEFLKGSKFTADEVRDWCVADSYALVDALLAQGKGMVLISAHLGNWELLARRAAVEGYRITVVARQGPDAAFNALTDKLRETAGYTVHPRGDSVKKLLLELRKGGIIAILPDQKSEDIFAPFFGVDTGTVAGPAVLALKTGAPIIPMFAPRQENGKYKMVLGQPIDTSSTGDRDADILRIMTDINSQVESIIRAYPDQWLWLHDRWKIRRPINKVDDLVKAL